MNQKDKQLAIAAVACALAVGKGWREAFNALVEDGMETAKLAECERFCIEWEARIKRQTAP